MQLILLKLLSKLPLAGLYILSDITFVFVYRIARYRVRITRENIYNAFPGWSRAKRLQLEKNYYRTFTASLAESVKAYSITKDNLQKRVSFPTRDIILDQLSRSPRIILLTAHIGNLEWLLLSTQLELSYTIDPVYRPAHSHAIDQFIFDIRSRFGATPIPYKKMAKDLILRHDIPRCIAVPADLRPRRREKTEEIPFLNQSTRFFSSVDRIAKRHQLPVILVTMRRQKRGFYTIIAKLITDGTEDAQSINITRRYAELVETHILSQPESWLWSHRRWKL